MKRADDKDDTYVLPTGRRFYANCGIIGLSDDDDAVTEGYDGGIDVHSYADPEEAWTVKERRELGQFMIARWTAWTEAQK